MRRAFNKLGSIEIEGSTIKYRISVQELGIDNPIELEREMKRKLQTVQNDKIFILPFDIKAINRYMILYFDVTHFVSLDYLRELDLLEKIPFYISLVELAKEQENGMNILWDRANFVCDKYENRINALLYETDSLKIYESPDNVIETVKELIMSTMTTLTVFVSLPKRHDFIDPTDTNIQFVENIYQMDNLDDLHMFLETVLLDLEQDESKEDSAEEKTVVKRSLFKKASMPDKKLLKAQTKKRTKQHTHYGASKKKKAKRFNNGILVGLAITAILTVVYFILMIEPSSDLQKPAATKSTGMNFTVNTNEYFKGSKELNNDLVQAYRKAYNSEYEESYGILSKMRKENLGINDIPLLIQVYDQTNHLPNLLDEVPSLANEVITYLLTKDKLDTLPDIAAKMERKNVYIEFEKAYLTEDYEYLLSMINEIKINGRKESQIVDAYLKLGKQSQARQFAEHVGNPDLIKRVEESTTY